jgi:hypothetical protein
VRPAPTRSSFARVKLKLSPPPITGARAPMAPADPAQRARNRRTALVLLSIAAVFFAGVVLRRWLHGA